MYILPENQLNLNFGEFSAMIISLKGGEMGVYRVSAGGERFILTLGSNGTTLGQPSTGQLVTGNLHVCEIGNPLILAIAVFNSYGEIVSVNTIENRGEVEEVMPLGTQDMLCAICGNGASVDIDDQYWLCVYHSSAVKNYLSTPGMSS